MGTVTVEPSVGRGGRVFVTESVTLCLVVGVRLCSTVWIWGDFVGDCVTHNHMGAQDKTALPLDSKGLDSSLTLRLIWKLWSHL